MERFSGSVMSLEEVMIKTRKLHVSCCGSLWLPPGQSEMWRHGSLQSSISEGDCFYG